MTVAVNKPNNWQQNHQSNSTQIDWLKNRREVCACWCSVFLSHILLQSWANAQYMDCYSCLQEKPPSPQCLQLLPTEVLLWKYINKC